MGFIPVDGLLVGLFQLRIKERVLFGRTCMLLVVKETTISGGALGT